MRLFLGIAVLGSLAASQALAQPPPPGSYQRVCRDIRMQGPFLSARCPSANGGWGSSSINTLSCRTDIGVDREGGLTCQGPGPLPGPGPGPGRPPPGPYPGAGGGRWSIVIFDKHNFRGRSVRIEGDMPNLERVGMNDQVGSIQLGRRAGPWLACTDANFRGRCVTIRDDVNNTRRLGVPDISSLRPLR